LPRVRPAETSLPPRVPELASWSSPEARARRRLIEATEEVRRAARALGLEVPGELGRDGTPVLCPYCPPRLRAEAWLWRASRLLEEGRR
jgi:hypothetical protein